MEFFKANTRIRFMRQRHLAAVFSGILFLLSLFSLFHYGLNLGLDFTGGTKIEMTFKAPVNMQVVRDTLKTNGFLEAVVQPYTPKDIAIRIGPHKSISQKALRQRIQQFVPNGHIVQLNYIGAEVGKTLMTNGILAIIVSLLATMIYIALRFDYRFAISAAVALIHDPILILGIFAFFHIEFNLIALAAVLTVIGYSLNDTIVVYDRIRENFRSMRKVSPVDVVDTSVNQTLSRTIMTSGLTLIVVLVLFFFGGQMIHGFALSLIIGIVIGTYSSIYVAGSLAVALGMNRLSLMPVKKQHDSLP